MYKDKLDPKCIKGEIAMAVTNRGELIPCCRCDDPPTINDPEFQKLLKVSKIEDYGNIQEILNTEEWRQFEANLKNDIGPAACWQTCRKNKQKDKIQTISIINTNNKVVQWEEKR